MRAALFLLALGLAGCVTPGRRDPAGDPLFGGGGAIPDRGGKVRTEDEILRTREPAPLPDAGRSSPAALTTGVTLGVPRAAAPKPGGPSASHSQPLPPPPPPDSYEKALSLLRSRGVDWQVMTQRGNDSWHFLCAIPDPKNPGLRDNYETSRPYPTPVAAMQAVLAEIDARRAGR